jgi:hypothetical protein
MNLADMASLIFAGATITLFAQRAAPFLAITFLHHHPIKAHNAHIYKHI